MLSDVEKEKIRQFMLDETLANAVNKAITKNFLAIPANATVNELAASRLAIDYLNKAWRDLQRCADEKSVKGRELENNAV